jgi:single-stranded-DNA-specific exonuclease
MVIVVAREDWHEGVVGIVAARLVDKFSKPAIVLSVKDGVAKGSARSIGDVNIYELIKENSEYLTKFGGHKMAAGLGLEVENLEAFKDAINKSAKSVDEKDFIPKNNITGILSVDDLDFEVLSILKNFEPYGEANLRPTFLLKEVEVVSVKLMGKDKSHSRIKIKEYSHQRKTVELIAFRTVYEMPQNRKITCSYNIGENEFNGRKSVQLLVSKIF